MQATTNLLRIASTEPNWVLKLARSSYIHTTTNEKIVLIPLKVENMVQNRGHQKGGENEKKCKHEHALSCFAGPK